MKVGTDAMLLGAFTEVDNQSTVLDVGAGTGVLSLMLAQKVVELTVSAIEYDNDALKDLKLNFQQSPFKAVFSILAQDFNTLELNQEFDVVISNPPFYKGSFTVGEKGGRSKARNEENLSFETLLTKSSQLLKPKGRFWFIFPISNYNEIKGLITVNQLFVEKEILVYGKPNVPTRIIACLTKVPITVIEKKSLTIRNSVGGYTSEYIELTKEFHLKDLAQIKKG